jgi:hypothetical protein
VGVPGCRGGLRVGVCTGARRRGAAAWRGWLWVGEVEPAVCVLPV